MESYRFPGTVGQLEVVTRNLCMLAWYWPRWLVAVVSDPRGNLVTSTGRLRNTEQFSHSILDWSKHVSGKLNSYSNLNFTLISSEIFLKKWRKANWYNIYFPVPGFKFTDDSQPELCNATLKCNGRYSYTLSL